MREQTAAQGRLGVVDEREYVEFWPAGALASGRFCCTACGNAVNVRNSLPRCLMCGARLWERQETSAYCA